MGCAGVTYAVYKGAQNVHSFVLGDRDNTWAFNVIIGGAALGAVGYGVYRHQFVISPSAVHSRALELLRQDPAVRDVLRLPLTAGKPVLSIVDGGQVHFKWGVLPRWRSQRIQMTFPVTGAGSSGVALVEAKKRWGYHLFKLLAVDVPSKAPLGRDTRVFVRGAAATDSGTALHQSIAERAAGQVLDEMRAPLQKVMAASSDLDRDDEEDDRMLRVQERRRAAHAAAERAARAPKPLDAGGGMYVHEQLYWRVYYGVQGVAKWLRGVGGAGG